MKNNIIILLFSILSSNAFGQSIDYNIVVLDTSEHFNPSPYSGAHLDSNLIIDSDSVFKEVFRWSPFKVGHPRFTKAIWLKRTIHGSCLTQIENTVVIDSTKRTVTWNTLIESGNCKSKNTRHIVIQIPTPPNNFTILFDTTFLNHKPDISITKSLEMSSFQYTPLATSQFPFLGSFRMVIDNDSLFTIWKEKDIDYETPDFRENLILANSYGGDCLMRLQPHAFFDAITNTLVLNVYNIWGGCRAGGRESIAVLVERPKDNFSVVFHEIQLDSWSEYKQLVNQTKSVGNKK